MLFVVFPLYIVVREQNFDSPLATVPVRLPACATVILNVTGTSSLSILNALNVSLFYRMIHRNLNI